MVMKCTDHHMTYVWCIKGEILYSVRARAWKVKEEGGIVKMVFFVSHVIDTTSRMRIPKQCECEWNKNINKYASFKPSIFLRSKTSVRKALS